jgi:hypothetical protein
MTLRIHSLRIPLRVLAVLALLAHPACSGCSDDSTGEAEEIVAPEPIVEESSELEGEPEEELEVGDADRISDTLPEGFKVVEEIPERVREDLVLYENAKVLQIADAENMGVLVVAVTTDDREKVMSTLTAALQEKSYQVEPFTGLPKGGMLVATKGARSLSYYIETDDAGRTRIELADLPLEN